MAAVFILCGVATAWQAFVRPASKVDYQRKAVFKETKYEGVNFEKVFLDIELAAEDEPLETERTGQQEELSSEKIELSDVMGQDVLEKCASLLKQGIVCMLVSDLQNLGQKAEMPSSGVDPVFQEHLDRRIQARIDNALARSLPPETKDASEDDAKPFHSIMPAAGMYFNDADGLPESLGLPERIEEPQNSFAPNADDTVAQAAIRAAVDMVNNRYADAVLQAQLNDGDSNINKQDVVALTQNAMNAAAERAFEKFIKDSFGKRDFKGQSYDGLRGYFTIAFKHAATSSIKSIGKRFVNDVTAGGDFKSLAVRSEILDGLDAKVAGAFIDAGLAAAKNSKYAFLRNLEVTYKIRENSKPEYSLLTLQPLYSSEGRKHNLFAQAAYSNVDSRNSFTGGLGYRYMPDSENYVVGTNAFIDYERPYGHIRAGMGVDVQTSLWGASANYYKGITDWLDAQPGFQEKVTDGFDVELAGRMPFLPALEVFGRAYRWQGVDGEEDTDGTELRVEYSPVPAFTLEGLINDEQGRETEMGLALRYNYTFGAPAEYLYDWDEQFRQKSASEYIFSKVRRDNRIRVQQRIDPDDPNAAGIIAAGLLSFSPLNAATGVSIGTDVSFTFDQDVQAGTGNIVFTDVTDNSDDFTIPVGDARVSIVNDTVTIDLSAQLLDFLSDYEVSFASGVFEDLGGNATAALNAGDYTFQTVVDPTAGFPAATVSVAPGGTVGSFEPATDIGSWQTTIDIGASPDGIIFESGATGQGIAASFGGGNLVFAAGDGASTSTGTDSIFGSVTIASIPQGLHHFVFVADPDAAAEIGLYIDGIRVINESIAGSMQSGEWAGTNAAGYGLVNSSVRAGVNASPLTGATLTNNLSFFTGVAPADF